MFYYIKYCNRNMVGFVYLIGEEGNDSRYKIGSTRSKDVNKRLKQLQTGNPNHLFIKESYQTEHPFKLEKMLHNRFKTYNVNGEWFELNEELVWQFKGICDYYSNIMESLRENPFFFKK